MAPCSHTWHYKCIRELLNGPSYPIFTCPNCRAAADLDAEVDEPDEEWQQLESGAEDASVEQIQVDESSPPLVDHSDDAMELVPNEAAQSAAPSGAPEAAAADGGEAGDTTMMLDHAPTVTAAPPPPPPEPAASSPVPIPQPNRATLVNGGHVPSRGGNRTPSPPGARPAVHHEGPLTPRNDLGPWVFDGDAGRSSQDISRPGAMSNLDAATAQVESNAS